MSTKRLSHDFSTVVIPGGNLATQSPVHGPPLKRQRSASTFVSSSPRDSTIPIIQSVRGAVGLAPRLTPPSTVNRDIALPKISDQVTLSVKGKENTASKSDGTPPPSDGQSKNPKEVANILSSRGIIVTPTARPNEPSNVPDRRASIDSAQILQKQLNNAVSIISVKKLPSEATIDLSADEADGKVGNNNSLQIKCPYKGCQSKFDTVQAVREHAIKCKLVEKLRSQKGTEVRSIIKCKMCPAKFLTSNSLLVHQRRIHPNSKKDPPKLNPIDASTMMGIPVVDLADPNTRSKLEALGIVNYIPLTNFNQENGGLMGLPIMSIRDSLKNTVHSMGAQQVLTIGRVRKILNKPKATNTNTNGEK